MPSLSCGPGPVRVFVDAMVGVKGQESEIRVSGRMWSVGGYI